MSSQDPATVAIPDSGSDSDTSECYSPVFPLLSYHIDGHRDAGSSMVKLFKAYTGKIDRDIAKDALRKIDSINSQIRKSNIENGVAMELGTIDACIFEHAWRNPDCRLSMEDFCRRQYYPVNWAQQPPALGSSYRVYDNQYWDSLKEWDIATITLHYLWELMRMKANNRLIENIEEVFRDFECDFNQRIDNLHQQYGNPESVALFLQSDLLIQHYRRMTYCLHSENKKLYEEYREILRRDCVFYGYPQEWVPEVYEEENA
ncbi:hypothetical protein BDV59DRAFT_211589 [Aspergillus ambiguus]|uniref:uncharacterized protein n=1 Tax=Aspergillus ambiguus TaxID=176160 RepID=UPI003CCCBC8F